MYAIDRKHCPHCEAECVEGELTCWKCGQSLAPPPAKPPTPAEPQASAPAPQPERRKRRKDESPAEPPKPLILFDDGEEHEPVLAPQPEKTTRLRTMLSGEVVEAPEPVPAPEDPEKTQKIAGVIGGAQVAPEPTVPLMRLTFCKECGYQNQEGARECAKCRKPLEVVEAGSMGAVEPLPRNGWFDVLGSVWIVLGLAAVYCGWFLVKANPGVHRASWSDYFWTGIVVCAPGIMIYLRLFFCKITFWVMTLMSAITWSVLFLFWITGNLYVSDNLQVGLIWLFVFSALSVLSWLTVRLNDAFDVSF